MHTTQKKSYPHRRFVWYWNFVLYRHDVQGCDFMPSLLACTVLLLGTDGCRHETRYKIILLLWMMEYPIHSVRCAYICARILVFRHFYARARNMQWYNINTITITSVERLFTKGALSPFYSSSSQNTKHHYLFFFRLSSSAEGKFLFIKFQRMRFCEISAAYVVYIL